MYFTGSQGGKPDYEMVSGLLLANAANVAASVRQWRTSEVAEEHDLAGGSYAQRRQRGGIERLDR